MARVGDGFQSGAFIVLENRLSKRSIDEINATSFIEELRSFLYTDEIVVDLGSVIAEFNLANVESASNGSKQRWLPVMK